jgi:hypothetical protein
MASWICTSVCHCFWQLAGMPSISGGTVCRKQASCTPVPHLENSEQVGRCCEQLMWLKVCRQLIQHSCMLLQDILHILQSNSM